MGRHVLSGQARVLLAQNSMSLGASFGRDSDIDFTRTSIAEYVYISGRCLAVSSCRIIANVGS